MVAGDVYRFIETWWGATLDTDLLQRIADAPDDHAEVFIEEWLALHQRWNAQGGDPSLQNHSDFVPLVGNEANRPSWSRHALGRAVALLLINQSVAVDEDFLFPIRRFQRPYQSSYRHRPLAAALYDLMAIRPLVIDGSLRFVAIQSPEILNPKLRLDMMSAAVELGKGDKGIWTSFGLKPAPFPSSPQYPAILEIENTLFNISGGVVSSLSACKRINATPIATEPWAEYAYQRLIAGRHLDGRITRVDILASVNVPNMVPKRIPELVAVRTSSDAYQVLRGHLTESLRDVKQLPESSEAIRTASNILYQELRSSLDTVQTSIRKSPALSSMKHGLKSFGLRAISAGAVLAATSGEGATQAVVQAVTDQAGDTIGDYLKRIRDRQAQKAIWGLVAAFNDLEDEAWIDPYWDIDQRIDKARRLT